MVVVWGEREEMWDSKAEEEVTSVTVDMLKAVLTPVRC